MWSLLGLSQPKGAKVGPSTFPAWPKTLPPGATPPFFTSLFVQYKRPDHLTTPRAKEWCDHHAPYYRMHLTDHQHQLLLDLGQAVGADGIVLYAAPSFWRYAEMWLKQGAGQIMEASMLIEALKIGYGHRLWTWTPGGRGVAHSEPEAGRYTTISELRDQLTIRARDEARKTPRAHLGVIASAMLEAKVAEKPRERWQDEFLHELEVAEEPVDEEVVSELADAAVVAEGASKARVSWLILAIIDRNASGTGE